MARLSLHNIADLVSDGVADLLTPGRGDEGGTIGRGSGIAGCTGGQLSQETAHDNHLRRT